MIRQLLRELSPFVDRRIRRRALTLAVSAVVSGVLEAAAILLTVGVAVSLTSSGDNSIDIPGLGAETSRGLTLGIAAASAVLVIALHAYNAYLSAYISSLVLHRARRRSIASYTRAGWSTQSLQREGALQETVTSLAGRTSGLVDSLTTGLMHIANLTVFLAVSLVVDFAATAVVIVIGAALVAGLRPVARATRRRAAQFVAANSAFAEDVSKLASTSMELRVFGVQRVAAQSVEEASDGVRRRHLRARFSLLLGVVLYKDLAILLLIGCIGGLLLVDAGAIDGLAVVVALMVRSLSFAQGANGSYQALNEGVSNVIALNERIGVLDAGVAVHGDGAVSTLLPIELVDVSYRYQDDAPALADVSVRLEPGQALGVVGPSGGGKSTFVQVLLRLRPPTSGTVLIDGIDYMEFDEAAWSRRIALVPQEPTLIEGTIADNIGYFRDIERAEIERAAADANVYDEIMRLPNGFDTVLGPRGSGLSGGQKQRVAIARALVGGPELLVMDEPSSALDVNSEHLLQQTIERLKGRITMVIVAHRMKTVEACDRLMVLDEGRIAQLGSPEELLGHEGFYRRVVEALQ